MSLKGTLTTADYLPMDEYRRMLKCLHRDKFYRMEAFALLSFSLALRAGDTLRLRWADVLGKEDVILTEHKTGKTSSRVLNEDARNRIAEIYGLLGNPPVNDVICRSRKTGLPLTRQAVNQNLKVIKSKYKLEIKNFSTHTFRKTFGRYVYEATGRKEESLVILNQIFHHTSIDITRRYIGLRADECNQLFRSIRL